MELAHGVWVGSQYMTLPTQIIWRVEDDFQCPSEARGRCYGGPGRASQRLLWKSGPSAGQGRGSMHPQPGPGTRPVRQAEFLGKSPWSCPGLSWLLLPLSLPPYLLPRNRGL